MDEQFPISCELYFPASNRFSLILCLAAILHHLSGAYPGFSEGGEKGGREEGGGCRDPPKKLTSQTSVQLG